MIVRRIADRVPPDVGTGSRMTNPLHTIGYSPHAIGDFLALLRRYGIDALCDVRSAPYSRRFPAYGRDALCAHLQDAGIAYVFLGAELGARPPEPDCYIDGRADYDRIAARPVFRQGIDRVLAGTASHRPALMCAEKDPLNCHRAILISRRLVPHGLDVRHIRADGTIEPQADFERRLVTTLKLAPPPMLQDADAWAAALGDAYRTQGRKIAFIEKARE